MERWMRDWKARLERRFGWSGGIEWHGWWLGDGEVEMERLEGELGGAAEGIAEAKVDAVLVVVKKKRKKA